MCRKPNEKYFSYQYKQVMITNSTSSEHMNKSNNIEITDIHGLQYILKTLILPY